jgi:hypothetical protein
VVVKTIQSETGFDWGRVIRKCSKLNPKSLVFSDANFVMQPEQTLKRQAPKKTTWG